MSINRLALATVPRMLILALLAVAAFAIGSPRLGIFIAGAVAGVMLRQVSLVRTSHRVTPVLLEVIDWHQVESLLGEPKKRAAE